MQLHEYGNYLNVGFPTTVSVSSAFLKQCMNDPEKAKHLEKNLVALPECAKSAVAGMYGADKAVASTLENCSKGEQGFMYDIIQQNFLAGNSNSMMEEERQANIPISSHPS